MAINPLKEFFRRRKAEAKFARAGPGKTLADATGQSSGPSASTSDQSARQAAADAAMKRFSKDTSKSAQRPRLAPQVKSQPEPGLKSDTTTSKAGATSQKVESIVQKELPVIDGVAQRRVQLYSTDELAQRMKQPEIDDDFFRLTVEDAKLFKQRYEEERARNEILKTSEMRRREAEAMKPTTNIARLRFKLPNNMVLEASFSGSEPLSLVQEWLVAECRDKLGLELKSFDILFGLKPFKGTEFEKSVKQLGLIPATTLTVVQKNN